MDCEKLKQIVSTKDMIVKGMTEKQCIIFNELLDFVCDDHDSVCECGESFNEIN